MLHIYGISNCGTVKKAITWLKENRLDYVFHDYKKEGVTAHKLKQWTKQFGWENVLNKASTTWKGLTEAERDGVTDENSAIKLMVEHTSLIKRPVLETGKKLLIKFKEEEYAKALLKN